MGTDFIVGPVAIGQGVMVLNSKGGVLGWIEGRDFFYHEGGETLAQVAQRGSRGPIPGKNQG